MVTYIIGKTYDKKILRRNIKNVDCQKKDCFLSEVKKSLQATKTLAPLPPPPPRYLMVRPLAHRVGDPGDPINKT